jgi:predicted SnoaL-like aldol condensation-catalyzing enzyme
VITGEPAVCTRPAAGSTSKPVAETAADPNTMFRPRRKPMSETNKDIAVAFYKKALFEGRVEDAFRLYAVPTYRQHNPLIEDGMEGVKKFVTWIMSNHPDARGEIKCVFADGDHVILHSHWHGLSDNPRGEAVVDIFRLEGGKVLEHWDVIQPIPETSANANTMF